jgi:undecaprenyl-diphosphatase
MEIKIVKFLNHWGLGSIDWMTELLSSYIFLFFLWYSIAIFFLIFNKKDGKKIFIGSVIAAVLYIFIGEVVFKETLVHIWGFRLRPYLAFPDDIVPLGKHNTDSSFPSNHMVSTVSMLTIFVYHYRKLVVPAAIFALLMAFARIHNGMHYPSDILAGTVLGIILGLISIFLAERILTKLKIRIK